MGSNNKFNHEQLNRLGKASNGRLFYGTVVSADPTTYNILVAPQGNDGTQKMQARMLSSMLCFAIGFKLSYIPTVGTAVFCYATSLSECLILGMVPTNDVGSTPPFSQRTIVGAGDGLRHAVHTQNYGKDLQHTITQNLGRPTDMLHGELAISNDFGVLLGLFQQLAVLKGSELSQIQCFLLDDLVRIISHNFQHFHGMGSHSISHDGTSLQLEGGLTHDPKEAMGIPQRESENALPTLKHVGMADVDDTDNFYQPVDGERLEAVERLKYFVGRLGDFVNIMLVAPGAKRRLMDGTEPSDPQDRDKGLLQIKASLDGLFVVRSVKGVVIEKTNWIRVPQRIRTPEDPEGDDGAKLEPPSADAFVFDNSYVAADQPFLYYLQLRDYLSYLVDGVGYRNFKQRAKDFHVNDDYTAEPGLNEITYVDPVTKTAYLKKTSSLVLMPNGGVSIRDAWGSGLNMEGGNIYIQPAKDLVLQPMRNLVGKIGGNLSLASRYDIGLSSTEGGVQTRSKKVQYSYSKEGGIVLHTDAEVVGNPGFLPDDASEPIGYCSGIVFKSADGGIFANAKYHYANYTESSLIDSKQNHLLSTNQLVLRSEKVLELLGDTTLVQGVNRVNIYSEKSALMIGREQTLVGKFEQKIGFVRPGTAYVEGLIKDDETTAFFDKMDQLIGQYQDIKREEIVPAYTQQDAFSGLLFKWPNSEVYGLAPGDATFPQTLAQQEDTDFGIHQFVAWTEVSDNETYPFPGADLAESFVSNQTSNLELVNGEVVNLTGDHTVDNTDALDKTGNVFQAYRVAHINR